MNDLQTLMNAYSACKTEKYRNTLLQLIAEEAENLITLTQIKTVSSTIERDKVKDYKLADPIHFDEIVERFMNDNPGIDANLKGQSVIGELGMYSYVVEGDGFVGDWKLWVVPAPEVRDGA